MIIYDPDGTVATIDAAYEHVQNTPDRVWSVHHDLGYRPTAVTVWIDDKVALVEIVYLDDNNLEIRLGSNEKGRVKVI